MSCSSFSETVFRRPGERDNGLDSRLLLAEDRPPSYTEDYYLRSAVYASVDVAGWRQGSYLQIVRHLVSRTHPVSFLPALAGTCSLLWEPCAPLKISETYASQKISLTIWVLHPMHLFYSPFQTVLPDTPESSIILRICDCW